MGGGWVGCKEGGGGGGGQRYSVGSNGRRWWQACMVCWRRVGAARLYQLFNLPPALA